MATVASLLISLVAQTEGFNRGLKSAERQLASTASSIQAIGRTISASLVAAFSVGAISNELRNIVNGGS